MAEDAMKQKLQKRGKACRDVIGALERHKIKCDLEEAFSHLPATSSDNVEKC